MGKSAPQAPTPPNPQVVAQAQTASNQQTALYQSQLNNGNSYGPTGSVTNQYNPATNQWTQNTTLSPAEQAIFNQGTAAQAGMLGVANKEIPAIQSALNTHLSPGQTQGTVAQGPLQYSYGAGGPIQSQLNGATMGDPAVQAAINASYGQATQMLNPQWQQATE